MNTKLALEWSFLENTSNNNQFPLRELELFGHFFVRGSLLATSLKTRNLSFDLNSIQDAADPELWENKWEFLDLLTFSYEAGNGSESLGCYLFNIWTDKFATVAKKCLIFLMVPSKLMYFLVFLIVVALVVLTLFFFKPKPPDKKDDECCVV